MLIDVGRYVFFQFKLLSFVGLVKKWLLLEINLFCRQVLTKRTMDRGPTAIEINRLIDTTTAAWFTIDNSL